MKRFALAVLTLLVGLSFAPAQEIKSKAGSPAKNDPNKPRGLKGISPAIQRATVPKLGVTEAIPAELAMVPERLSMWGNNRFGLCVTTEEVCAKMAWAKLCGVKLWITEEECIRWANAHGILNGAYLTQTLNWMQKDPLTDDQGRKWLNGGYAEVDYTKEANLKSGLAVGPLKIAIDADALPSDAGDRQGWYAVGQGRYPNTDHCVPILGYGSAKFLYEQIGAPLPAAIKPDQQGFLVFTWSTIGFVDFKWLQGTCVESYARNPTTVGMSPKPPEPPTPPDPPIPPVPTPSKPIVVTVDGVSVTLDFANKTATLPSGWKTNLNPTPKEPTLQETLASRGLTPAQIELIMQIIAAFLSKSPAAANWPPKLPEFNPDASPMFPDTSCYIDSSGRLVCPTENRIQGAASRVMDRVLPARPVRQFLRRW